MGIVEFGHVDEQQAQLPLSHPRRFEPVVTVKNQITVQWGKILGSLLQDSPGSYNYAIRTAYLEFSNNGSITAPSPGRDASREYYQNLNANVNTRDYLRVSVAAAGSENSDDTTYEEDNVFYFAGQTEGNEGVHGLEFSDSEGSTIYGGALVAARDDNNPSLDLIFARLYAPQAQQLAKLANRQVAFRWGILFG